MRMITIKRSRNLPEIPSVDSRMAEMPDPETGEYDEPGLDDPFRRGWITTKENRRWFVIYSRLPGYRDRNVPGGGRAVKATPDPLLEQR